MAGGNLADCSASATAHTGDSALINRISDDCSAGSQQSKTGKVTVRIWLDAMPLYNAQYTVKHLFFSAC